MVSYKIVIAPRALKDLKSFPGEIIKQVSDEIDCLGFNPRPVNCKKLKGPYSGEYRIEVRRNYRVRYRIFDHEKVIHVLRVMDRKESYRS